MKLKKIFLAMCVALIAETTIFNMYAYAATQQTTVAKESKVITDDKTLGIIQSTLEELTTLSVPDPFATIREASPQYILTTALGNTKFVDAKNSKIPSVKICSKMVHANEVDKTIAKLFGNEVKVKHGSILKPHWRFTWNQEGKVYTQVATGGGDPNETKILECVQTGDLYTVKVVHYNFRKEYLDSCPDKVYKDSKGRQVLEHYVYNIEARIIGKVVHIWDEKFPEGYIPDQTIGKQLVHEYTLKKQQDGSLKLQSVKKLYQDLSKGMGQNQSPTLPDNMTEMNRQKADMNKDGVEDKVVLYGTTDGMGVAQENIVRIYDGRNSKVIAEIEGYEYLNSISSIEDVNGDGYKDILFSIYDGGVASIGSVLFINNKDTFVEAKLKESLINYKFLDGFKYEVEDKISGKSFTVDLSSEQKQRYIEHKVFDRKGNYIAKTKEEWWRPTRDYLEDIDQDGTSEYVKRAYISLLYNAESVVNIKEVYKFKNGQLVLEELSGYVD